MKNFQPLIDDIQDSFTFQENYINNQVMYQNLVGEEDALAYDFATAGMAAGVCIRELIKIADRHDFSYFIGLNDFTRRLRIVFH